MVSNAKYSNKEAIWRAFDSFICDKKRVIRTLDNSQLSIAYVQTMFISSFWVVFSFQIVRLHSVPSRYRSKSIHKRKGELFQRSNIIFHLLWNIFNVFYLEIDDHALCLLFPPCLQPVNEWMLCIQPKLIISGWLRTDCLWKKEPHIEYLSSFTR